MVSLNSTTVQADINNSLPKWIQDFRVSHTRFSNDSFNTEPPRKDGEELSVTEGPSPNQRILLSLLGNFPRAELNSGSLKTDIDITDDIYDYIHPPESVEEDFLELNPIESISLELFGDSDWLYNEKAFLQLAKETYITSGQLYETLEKIVNGNSKKSL